VPPKHNNQLAISVGRPYDRYTRSLADPERYRGKVPEFRRRLAKIEAFRHRDERDAIILMYLDQNDGSVRLALEEYVSTEV